MSIQEIWKIKEKLSEKFWGKSANEVNAMIKPNVEGLKRKIEQLRRETTNLTLNKKQEALV